MGNKMLIDAGHPEETRVVVVHGTRVEEFDFESENKKQLRGNIYLAKVTRVEPSLQAAFVEYGGNRHGFLAFSEIHPDYYQIPVADRERLLKEQAAEDDRADYDVPGEASSTDEEPGAMDEEAGRAAALEAGDTAAVIAEDAGTDADNDADQDTTDRDGAGGDEKNDAGRMDTSLQAREGENGNGDDHPLSDETVESAGSEDALEEIAPRTQRRSFRSYKIQEVIKRRQVLLVQVVKEERGNKGAALTTYLSLAGRYCVLMPNTARGGGISRKITNASDRKKLKSAAESLDVPAGMGLIIRTAGANRTKAEIKRDYEYLLRMWESVRELTLGSSAPALVYEEGSLIKRSIRDLYDKDIDAILVDGDEGYREAKDFMRMLMPSHAKNVQPYKEKQPLFQKYQVDQQLDSMFNPVVQLKSGGYIVINPTEALVSIDVNSGRATKERNIETTALKTNLEAAAEVARQMRLRDLAGLIVIDFIDMEENRNNRAVERKLKECLKSDRARIQIGRISHFGLLEMSRQRMRAGMLEGSTVVCPACQGSGLIRSVESTALHVLRAVEAEALKGTHAAFTLKVPADVAFYVLNQKRTHLLDIEARCAVSIFIESNPALQASDYEIQPADARDTGRTRPAAGAVNIESTYQDDDADMADAASGATVSGESVEADEPGEDEEPKKRRRPRRRRKPKDETSAALEDASTDVPASDRDEDADAGSDEESDSDNAKPKSRRRRGRRGGRRNRRGRETAEGAQAASNGQPSDASDNETAAEAIVAFVEPGEPDRLETFETADSAPSTISGYESEPEPEPVLVSYSAPTPTPAFDEEALPDEPALSDEEAGETPGDSEPEGPSRRGWWQRRSG